MRRRRRNPGGVIEWAKAHPWMTFFLVGAAIQVPVALLQVAAMKRAAVPPAPADPSSLPTPPPQPTPVPPALGGGVVFVPGVIDPNTGKV